MDIEHGTCCGDDFRAILCLLGIYILVFPQLSVKKEVQATSEIIQQVKRSGKQQIIFGAVLIVIGFIAKMVLQ